MTPVSALVQGALMATLCLGLAGPAIAQTGAAWQPFEESWTGFRGGRL